MPRALSSGERQQVLDVLHAPRFVDRAPAEVIATLLDEGQYLCSERTIYRVLDGQREVRERHDQRRCPVYEKPELLAARSNALWSWDITKLRGPATWTYCSLCVILDVFSRYVVGWMVADKKELKKSIGFLDQDYLDSELTEDRFKVSSPFRDARAGEDQLPASSADRHLPARQPRGAVQLRWRPSRSGIQLAMCAAAHEQASKVVDDRRGRV
ncbi:Mobile element protein [Minicystis rosea]|nr:Mobile element protein [Minicystis rosea]